MTIVILQCKCETNLVLAANTETKTLMGYCPKCRGMYDIVDVNLTDKDLKNVQKRAREQKKPEGPMFYMRCTELLDCENHPAFRQA